MIQKLEITGVHRTVDDRLRKYVAKKIGGLDRYMPRHARESAHAEVHLKEGRAANNNHCSCEATLHLPHRTIVVKEKAPNIYAAVDIVEAKLKQQLAKYKDLHGAGGRGLSGKTRRHVFARFRGRPA